MIEEPEGGAPSHISDRERLCFNLFLDCTWLLSTTDACSLMLTKFAGVAEER